MEQVVGDLLRVEEKERMGVFAEERKIVELVGRRSVDARFKRDMAGLDIVNETYGPSSGSM